MTGEQLDEKAIFNAARGIPSGEARAEFLRQTCGADATLLQRIESLLRGYEEQASFLESPVCSPPHFGEGLTTAQPSILEQPGTTIGPYKLLQQIGEGGMGVVFMAEQSEPIQRSVALKIIKPGMDTRQVIARFEAERQALAMMDHPNIARVLDAGMTNVAGTLRVPLPEAEPSDDASYGTRSVPTTTGRPYFVMELVKGVPITEFCDEKQLSVRERMELLLPVCEAVQHAHQKGIIHRDIKPTNVLVAEYDNHAVPKVIDFGVAKATGQKLTERTMFTEFGQVIGTVEYMSPEQAKFNQLDIDTRSDIYSLGVLLYELLTGSTPFEQKRLREAAFDEVLRIIREEEPPKPSTRLSTSETLPAIAANRHTEPAKLSHDVRGELDWIVMKALDKDRNRRYETANGLVRDIERYLLDEPVQACPPSAVYRFRKFARRNRAALVGALGAVATLLLIVIGLAVSNQMIRAERNQKAAALADREQALALAKTEGQRAEDNFLRASIAIRDVLTKAATGQGEWSALPSPLRKRLSEEAVKFYDSLLLEDSPDPNRRYEAAVGHRAIGTLHVASAEPQRAEQSFRRSIAILEALVRQHPTSSQYRHQLAWSYVNLSRALRGASANNDAIAAIQKAITLYEKLLNETPASGDFQSELSTCYIDLSRRLANASKFQQADAVLNTGISLLDNPANAKLNAGAHSEQLGRLLLSLGRVRAADGRYVEARAAFKSAAGNFERAFSTAKTAPVLYGWIDCYKDSIELAGFDMQMAEGDEIFQAFLDAHAQTPENLQSHRDLRAQDGHMRKIWAGRLREAGRSEEAMKGFDESAAVFESLAADEPDISAFLYYASAAHQDAAGLLLHLGRHQHAGDQIRKALDLYEKYRAAPPDPDGKGRLADGANSLAWLLATSPVSGERNPLRAVELASTAVEINPGAGHFWNTLGVAQYRAKNWAAAGNALNKSMELRNGGDSFDWFLLAMTEWKLGHPDTARRWFDKAVSWMNKHHPENHQLRQFRAEADELMRINVPPASDDDNANGNVAVGHNQSIKENTVTTEP